MRRKRLDPIAALIRACTPARAMPVGCQVLADIRHPSDGATGSVVKLASGAEVFFDGVTYRSLQRDWRDAAEWTSV